MGLYGLDLIIDGKGKKHICEITGVRVGMSGFKEIYGDDRVNDKVFGMLKRKHGSLTVNDGTYARNNFKKEHPIEYYIGKAISKSKLLSSFFFKSHPTPANSEIDWINEDVAKLRTLEFPFDSYVGQESYVINMWNDEIPHPTVNSFVSESISGNKFLQYMLLKNSEISSYITESILVGLGAVNEEKLEKLLLKHNSFVVKPILGYCGKGVKFFNKKEVKEKYSGSRGPIDFVNFSKILLFSNQEPLSLLYLEDLIDNENFSFELGLSLIQPFVNSGKRTKDGKKYSSIRAIICEGEFIDAYSRVSLDKKVNLSHDASAISFKTDNSFRNFCEDVVEIFENETEKYHPKSFKKTLYSKYIEERGRTSESERSNEPINPFLDKLYFFMTRDI